MTQLGVLKRLALVTAVLFGALNYVAWVRLGFAGQVPDLNPLGAELTQMIDFRAALNTEGRALFNGTYRPLDFGFLVCLTALLCLCARLLRPRRMWWAVMGLALIYGCADLIENHLLAQFVNEGTHPNDIQRAGWINLSTRVKFAALLLAAAAGLTSWRDTGASR